MKEKPATRKSSRPKPPKVPKLWGIYLQFQDDGQIEWYGHFTTHIARAYLSKGLAQGAVRSLQAAGVKYYVAPLN